MVFPSDPWLQIGAKLCLSFSEHGVTVPRDLCFSQVYLGSCQSALADPAWAQPPLLITDTLGWGVLCVNLATVLDAACLVLGII